MRALRLTLCTLLFAIVLKDSWQKETLTTELDICRLFVDDTKLRKPGTCDEGIVCKGGKSFDAIKCTGKTPFYLRDTFKCASKTSDVYCKTACSKTSSGYIADPKNCKCWLYCNGATEVAHDYCAHGMYYDVKSGMCVYPKDSTCVAYYNLCDVAPPETPFRDEINCHRYFQCNKKGVLETKECEVGKYYVAELGYCIAKAQVDCYKHPLPVNGCGTVKQPIRDRFVDDHATCRGYFYCKTTKDNKPDPNPTWSQCKFGEFFDEGLQACTARAHTKCSEDRCDGRESGREVDETSGCHHYLECKNNYTISTEFCGYDMWFDATTGRCENKFQNYGACA